MQDLLEITFATLLRLLLGKVFGMLA